MTRAHSLHTSTTLRRRRIKKLHEPPRTGKTRAPPDPMNKTERSWTDVTLDSLPAIVSLQCNPVVASIGPDGVSQVDELGALGKDIRIITAESAYCSSMLLNTDISIALTDLSML